MRRILGNSGPKEEGRKWRDRRGELAAIGSPNRDPCDVGSLSAIFGYPDETADNQSTSERAPFPKIISAKDAPDFGSFPAEGGESHIAR